MDEETTVFGESPVTPSKSSRTRLRGKAIPQLEDITENDAVTSKASPATPTRRARLRHTSVMEETDSPNEKATPQRLTRQRRASLLQDIVEKDTGLIVDASPRALRAARRRESKENEVLTPARRSRRVSSARLSVESSSPGGTVRKSPRLSTLVSPVSNTLDTGSSQKDNIIRDTIPIESTDKTSDTKSSSNKPSNIKYEGKPDTDDLISKNGVEDENRQDKKIKTKKEIRKTSIGTRDEKEQKPNFDNDDYTQDQIVVNDTVQNVDNNLMSKPIITDKIVKTRNTIFPTSNDNASSLLSASSSSTRRRTASLDVLKNTDLKPNHFFSDNEARRKSATANIESSKSSNKSKANKSDTHLNECLDESFAKILKKKASGDKNDQKSKDQQKDISGTQTEVITRELMVPIEGKVVSSIQVCNPEFQTEADSKKDLEESNFSTEDQLVPVATQDNTANKCTNSYLSDQSSNTLRKSKRISQKLSENNIFSPHRDYTDSREIEPMDVDITITNSVINDSETNKNKDYAPPISSSKNIDQFSYIDKSATKFQLETSKSDKRNSNSDYVKHKKDSSDNTDNSTCQSKSTFILSVNKSNHDSIEESSQIRSIKSTTPVKLSSNDLTQGKSNYTKIKEIATNSPISQGMMTTSTPVDTAKITEKHISGKRKIKQNIEELLVGSTNNNEKRDLDKNVKEVPYDHEVKEKIELKNQEASKSLSKSNSEISTKRTEISDILDATKPKSETNFESSSSDSESSENILLDRDAIDAGDAYESGDSMNSSSRNEIRLNDIPVKGVSLNSEDSVASNSDISEYEKDSFVVSTEDDEEGMCESDELTQSDLDLDMSRKSKGKYNKRKIREQKKASREMFEARHGLQSRNKSKLDESKTSESDTDEIVTQSKRKARMRIDSTIDTSNDEAEITIQNASFKKDPLLISTIKHEEISIPDATITGDYENINDTNLFEICNNDKGSNEEDDGALSENEDIANDYASLLQKLRNTPKNLSLTNRRKSLSALQNKEKTSKNKLLEELNITTVQNIPEKIKSNDDLPKSYQTGQKMLPSKFQDATINEIFHFEMKSVDSSSAQEEPQSEKPNKNEKRYDSINAIPSLLPSNTIFQLEMDRNELSAGEEGKERTKRSDESGMKKQLKHRVSHSKEQGGSKLSSLIISSPSKQEKLVKKKCTLSGLLNKDTILEENLNETPALALKSEHKFKSRKYDTDKKLLEVDDFTSFGEESGKSENSQPASCLLTGKSCPIQKQRSKRSEKLILSVNHNTNSNKLFKENKKTGQDNTKNKAKKRKSTEDVQPKTTHEILRLPEELLAQLEDEPQPKKRKQKSTSHFVVENIQKSSKPSHYLEESVHIEFSKKKQSVKKSKTRKISTVSKILPSVPNATTSGSGFTTNFKVCVLNETKKPVVKAYDFSSFKNERFNKIKRTEASGYLNKFRF